MKKLLALLAASAWMLVLASAALAAAPLNGDYQSTDLGGPVDQLVPGTGTGTVLGSHQGEVWRVAGPQFRTVKL